MATYKGTVKKNDLEGGFLELHTDDGKRYQLQGGDRAILKEGERVEVTGSVEKAAFGIGMTGPILAVKSVKSAK